MKKRRVLVPLVLLAVLLPITLPLASCRAGKVGLIDGRLQQCPSKPNCVCSEYPGERSSIEPLAIEGDPAAAFRSLVAFLEEEPRVELATVTDDYVHAVFKTRFLRFRDDVEFRLDTQANVIHVRSASRIGYSDLGKNRDRVESIRERWTEQAR